MRQCAIAIFVFLPLVASPAVSEIPTGQVHLGVDVLVENGFEALRGKRVGLIANHTARSRENRSTVDLLHETDACELVALFSPEHGIRGDEDDLVDSSRDDKTRLPIQSLYGKTRKPTPEMLEGLDVLVFDIQDIGTRFYTYIGTMALAMQAARESGVSFLVLDRPNPIGGVRVEGAVPPSEQCGGIVSIFPIPTRHGMTVGELAVLFNEDFGVGCDLSVIRMKGWNRSMFFDETGLLWRPTSPNMKTLNGAIIYPGMGVLEGTLLSCGRGTDRPFECYGAPYLDAGTIAADLNTKGLPGVRFVSQPFTPTAPGHKFQGELCQGVYAVIHDRSAFDPILAGLHFIQAVHRRHPDKYTREDRFATLIGDSTVWDRLTSKGETPESVLAGWQKEVERFNEIRARRLFQEYED